MMFVEEDILEGKFGLGALNFKKNSASLFTESQNGSFGRGHWRSSGPSSLHRVVSTWLLSISRGDSTTWNCRPEDLICNLVLLTERNFFLHVSDQSSSEKKFWNIVFNNCFNRHNVGTVQLNFSKALE